MAEYVPQTIAAKTRLRAKGSPHSAFRYADKGTLATIGRSTDVAWIERFRFSGQLAWFA